MKNFESIDLKNFDIDTEVLSEVPLSVIEKHQILPIKKDPITQAQLKSV